MLKVGNHWSKPQKTEGSYINGFNHVFAGDIYTICLRTNFQDTPLSHWHVMQRVWCHLTENGCLKSSSLLTLLFNYVCSVSMCTYCLHSLKGSCFHTNRSAVCWWGLDTFPLRYWWYGSAGWCQWYLWVTWKRNRCLGGTKQTFYSRKLWIKCSAVKHQQFEGHPLDTAKDRIVSAYCLTAIMNAQQDSVSAD